MNMDRRYRNEGVGDEVTPEMMLVGGVLGILMISLALFLV